MAADVNLRLTSGRAVGGEQGVRLCSSKAGWWVPEQPAGSWRNGRRHLLHTFATSLLHVRKCPRQRIMVWVDPHILDTSHKQSKNKNSAQRAAGSTFPRWLWVGAVRSGAVSSGSSAVASASQPLFHRLPPGGPHCLPLFFSLLNMTVFVKGKVMRCKKWRENANPLCLHFANRHTAAKQGCKRLVIIRALEQQLTV